MTETPERDRFEQHIGLTWQPHVLSREHDGRYEQPWVQERWLGWLACAAGKNRAIAAFEKEVDRLNTVQAMQVQSNSDLLREYHDCLKLMDGSGK